MNDNKFVISSHGFGGTKFYWDLYDYETEPYFTVLKKNGDRYLIPKDLLSEVLKNGVNLVEDSKWMKNL